MATTSNEQFYMSNYFPLVDVPLRVGEQPTKRIDFFNHTGAQTVRNLQPFRKITWRDNRKMDVVSFQLTGSVSAWWMPVLYNGQQHPYEITDGYTVTLPALNASILNTGRKVSGRGSRVTI